MKKKMPMQPKAASKGAKGDISKLVDTVECVADAHEARPDTGGSVSSFPVVGLGASAGGLAAFEAFFSGMPADSDPGMAFVLVQHLAPDHKSLLTELIGRYTRMQVFEVEDGMRVQPNCAYIIPPNRDMAFLNGALQLLEPAAPHGRRLPIDFFFRSLAQDQGERAIGIVLSGTGSDGTLGVRAIKGEGGMVMAQTPATTEYDGMPRNALATGLVDYELPPAEMPAQLLAYAAHALGGSRGAGLVPAPMPENALKKIFVLVRAQTGHDFSHYKPSTIGRRIERRMAVHQIATIENYVNYLQRVPGEVDSLFRDLLIGVTNFFRDPEAFLVFRQRVIPQILARKQEGEVIRVWSAGCSTGEEAYSLAMLLVEEMQEHSKNCVVQIFATDLDGRAITMARAGLYPASIANDLTPERLARFFTVEADGGAYRIHKGIRDMVIFSVQDLIKDPPFSKLDLLCCRNVMIYMSAHLQRQLIPLFHYALNPGGTLFLGTSETVGDSGNLFTPLDVKQKIYQRREDVSGTRGAVLSRVLPMVGSVESQVAARVAVRRNFPIRQPLREMAEQAMLAQVVQVGALVNGQGDILYFHGRTGRYLEPVPGEATTHNILAMAREGLRAELTRALHQAWTAHEVVRHAGLRVKTNGHYSMVNLTVCPVASGDVATPGVPLYLVILEEAPEAPMGAEGNGEHLAKSGRPGAADMRIAELKEELRDKEEYLRSSKEELEASNEELKSANEELQSLNEEMQSTNEELETSKEELQSVNEELNTVNTELQSGMMDLSRVNNDMNNLLSGTGIATVFVDHELRILRFTPATTRLINLIQTDVGRPVGHIVSNLVGYTDLVADVQLVLNTLVPKEVEVQTTDGQWYQMRLMPYRTREHVIEGAVITFVDITEMQRVKESLRKANEDLRLAVVVRDAYDAITVQDLEGRILAWNPGAVRMYGWNEAEALAMHVHERIPRELRKGELATLARLSEAKIIEPYATRRLRKDGGTVEVSILSTALVNAAGEMYAIATTEREVKEK
jgi:two-component system CheB/CheR fusion protein